MSQQHQFRARVVAQRASIGFHHRVTRGGLGQAQPHWCHTPALAQPFDSVAHGGVIQVAVQHGVTGLQMPVATYQRQHAFCGATGEHNLVGCGVQGTRNALTQAFQQQGESFVEIAKFLFIDEQTARRHLKDYFDNGKSGGSSGGCEGKLTQEQADRLRAILATCDVPTAQTAVEKVKSLFSIQFSISGMTDWLNRNRFSFKKSEPAPAKACPLAQAEFIDIHHGLKDGLPEGEVVLFLDAAHPTRATKLGYGWSIKGERKIVATTAGKTRVNVIGTLNAQTLKLVTKFAETDNSETLTEHFVRLRRSYPRTQFPTLNSSWIKAPTASARSRRLRPTDWASDCGTFPLIHPTLT
jgi:transposase